ncbi:uncharacterized protein BXZ73DRAFT_44525 [Epithele typhae]|uniref:uncharacterized protein n=1 Tax=Epithele typhae TaxID=378194 RepID=UPI0020088233|nr:uncharacterized protein BXZ73DRAFT_44525 [Epithele typhae]KAH9938892.1 hypothetical protein BXZ73DRAFT_44525 [Epithele typhae]
MPTSLHLFTLPSELLENVFLSCVLQRSPLSIAALAQTCRTLRVLIYDTADSHLWRSLCLVYFDDPRLHPGCSTVHWRHMFTERVWAERYLDRHARPLEVTVPKHNLRSTRSMMLSLDKLGPQAEPHVHIRLLTALLDAVQTIAPAPGIRVTSSPSSTPLFDSPLALRHADTPILPPSCHIPPNIESRNVAWLQGVLTHGLPISLTRIIAWEDLAPSWKNHAEGPLLCELIARLGFLPIPLNQVSAAPEHRSPPSSPTARSKPQGMIDLSEEMQRRVAHEGGRPLAFSMRFLSRQRAWGPFLRVDMLAKAAAPTDDAEEEMEGDDEDDEDADYVPPDDPSDSDATPGTATHPVAATPGAPSSTNTLPDPGKLFPDWTWIAASRVVAEWKLFENIKPADLPQLYDWNNLRAGAWIAPRPPSGEGNTVEYPAGEEWKAHQWDWAGVEGVWRRLVCWLDYDELIYNNRWGSFVDENLDEAWIIVPMSVRITGYEPPSLPKEYPNRPTILFEGEMGGGVGWVGTVSPLTDYFRRVRGRVSMLPDGRVWYSSVSSALGRTADERVSEVIQLGPVGSAMGALGLWTDAQHEVEDPLGVVWQWRVA